MVLARGRQPARDNSDEPVHRGEDDGHRELVRVDKIERLAHRDEDLAVDALRHPVLLHELQNGELVLPVDEALALRQHRKQRGHHLHLLSERQHLCVGQDGQRHVERGRHTRQELEGSELARLLLSNNKHACTSTADLRIRNVRGPASILSRAFPGKYSPF
eukprot:119898-Pleurochrysis_carterae.AAC.1